MGRGQASVRTQHLQTARRHRSLRQSSWDRRTTMTTTAAASVSERLDAIARRYPSTGIRALLSLRGRDPFARQELAQLISRDTTLTERLHTSYRESRVNRPSNQPFTARDILDHWGYRVVHTSTVGNAISDIIGPAYF